MRQVLDEVRAIAQRMEKRERATSRAAGHSVATWRLLSAMSHAGGGTVPQLARQLGLSRQSVQRVADRLTEAGLTSYQGNPHHRRSPRLALTAAGTALLNTLERQAVQSEPDLRQDLEDDEIETTLYVLRALRAVL